MLPAPGRAGVGRVPRGRGAGTEGLGRFLPSLPRRRPVTAGPAPNTSTRGDWAVLGVRHHGPGSARSVIAELDRVRPADDVIEHRLAGQPPFAALDEAMAELRAQSPPATDQRREDRREAFMRQTLRRALKGADGPVAVVCGAWHAPALSGPLPPATADTAVLRGMPKIKTKLAWVPWTHSRLATASGYGAGVTSPGWYHHLLTAPDHVVTRWLTAV